MSQNYLPSALPDFSRPTVVVKQQEFDVWLYPQLLSIDTPIISVLWQLLLARTFHVEITLATLVTCALCVWMIYAGDHLLDVSRGSIYSARHEFVRDHRNLFATAIAIAFAISAALLFALPREILITGILLSSAVMLYLVVVHAGKLVKRIVPKEAMVAILFAAGSSIAVWSDPAKVRTAWPVIALFAALCLLNCAAVDARESVCNVRRTGTLHPVTRWIGTHLFWFACGLAVAAFVTSGVEVTPLAIALSVASLSLVVVTKISDHMSSDMFRLVADLALLLPALLVLL